MSGWNPQPNPLGYPINSLQLINFPVRFVRHEYLLGELTPIASGLDQLDASFWLFQPLADDGSANMVSFR